MKPISMLMLALIAAIVAAAIAQDSNTESKAANPTQGKFGPTLLRVATFYYIYRDDYGNWLSMEHRRCAAQESCKKEIITSLFDREARHEIRCVRHLREKTK